jgi:hypothetical protein
MNCIAAKEHAAAAGESLKATKAAAKESGDASAVKPAVDALMAAKKELDELEKVVSGNPDHSTGAVHRPSHRRACAEARGGGKTEAVGTGG